MTVPSEAAERHDTGPGALETAIILGLSVLIAAAILLFFEGWLADLVATLVNAAHGGS